MKAETIFLHPRLLKIVLPFMMINCRKITFVCFCFGFVFRKVNRSSIFTFEEIVYLGKKDKQRCNCDRKNVERDGKSIFSFDSFSVDEF